MQPPGRISQCLLLLLLKSRGLTPACRLPPPQEVFEARPSLLDLLGQFPSCKPPLDALLDALPALPARMYSVACSPLEMPDKVGLFGWVHAWIGVGWGRGMPGCCRQALDGTAGLMALADLAP